VTQIGRIRSASSGASLRQSEVPLPGDLDEDLSDVDPRANNLRRVSTSGATTLFKMRELSADGYSAMMQELVARARTAPHWAYVAANLPLIAAVFLFLRYHTFLWGALGLGGAAAVVLGTVRNRPGHRLPWILIAMALGTFISCDITYDVLTKYLHESNPFPSVADVFYLLTYPLAAAGLVGFVRARRQERDLGALLDALIVTAGAALLSWIFLIQPYVHAHGMTYVTKAVSIAYPLGDILFLCLLARLLAGGGLRNASLRFLTAGVVGVLVADCVYGWIQLNGSWKVGGPTDIGWVAFYVLWGAAAMHPSMRALTERQPQRGRHISVSTLVALSVATLAGPCSSCGGCWSTARPEMSGSSRR
jgi:hypothetical protein